MVITKKGFIREKRLKRREDLYKMCDDFDRKSGNPLDHTWDLMNKYGTPSRILSGERKADIFWEDMENLVFYVSVPSDSEPSNYSLKLKIDPKNNGTYDVTTEHTCMDTIANKSIGCFNKRCKHNISAIKTVEREFFNPERWQYKEPKHDMMEYFSFLKKKKKSGKIDFIEENRRLLEYFKDREDRKLRLINWIF